VEKKDAENMVRSQISAFFVCCRGEIPGISLVDQENHVTILSIGDFDLS
jgi:hypothetical protein